MAVTDHLKVAATELMKAASLLRQEIDDLRRDEQNMRLNIDKNTVLMAQEMQSLEHELTRLGDNGNPAQLQSSIQSLRLQIANKKRELDENRRQIEDAIKSKQSQISSIESQSRSIMP